MNSHRGYRTRTGRTRRGSTLLELLIVFAVTAILIGSTLPIGIRFLQTQILDEAAGGILETLRRAHQQAVFQKNDSAGGVKFLSGSYILFQGDAYALRDPDKDEEFSLPIGVAVSGIDEIVFAKLTGTPNASGTIVVTFAGGERSLYVNTQGVAER